MTLHISVMASHYVVITDIFTMSIESILASERKKHNLPITKLSEFLYTPTHYHRMKDFLTNAPVLPFDPNMYNKDRI